MIYPDMKNRLGTGARDHALHEHTVMKKQLVELDGMDLGHSDGSLNTKYVDLMRGLKQVRGLWEACGHRPLLRNACQLPASPPTQLCQPVQRTHTSGHTGGHHPPTFPSCAALAQH
jgi:hypothetical protein